MMSCALHRTRTFQVVPDSPAYSLRFPNSYRTSFPDILRDYNGFKPADSFIDLRPLMELRIENAYYEKGSSRKGVKGFLGTETAHYEILPQGLQMISVQPMLNRPAADLPVQQLIAPPVQHGRYYRLYFEIVFNSADRTHGSVLLSADSKQEMEQLSAQLQNPETVCGTGSTHCAAFPEACSVEMKVDVNGRGEVLNWGSFLSSLTGDRPKHIELKRLFGGRLVPVRIKEVDAASLRFPLLPGDSVSWR